MHRARRIINKNIRQVIIVVSAMLLVVFASASVLADTAGQVCDEQGAISGSLVCGKCGNNGCVWTAGNTKPPCSDSSDTGVNNCLQGNPIVKDLNKIVDFLSIGAGLIIIIMIVVGGIQYITAGGNSNATGAAKKRIINAFIALALFLFAFTFLQWLIPGGL